MNARARSPTARTRTNGVDHCHDDECGARNRGLDGAWGGPAMTKILLVQGANLTFLGRREPAIYGTTTAAELDTMLHISSRPSM